VLYDHFHHPHSAINQDFTADTYLFILISGFTTALQLRETPIFKISSAKDCRMSDNRMSDIRMSDNAMEGGEKVYTCIYI
jgi:hypothetical protein